jgi:transcriptional regulator with XRE-family HTH domain
LKNLKEKYKLIIDAIRKRVSESKISQKQIAEDLEIPYQTLRQLFIDKKSNGQMPSVPSSQNLLAIALYLELDLQRILYPEKALTEQDLDKIILNAIISIRKKKGINREELASAINFPLGTVNDIEGGQTKRIPALFLLMACQFLDIDITLTLKEGEAVELIKVPNNEDEDTEVDLVKKVEQLTNTVEGIQKELKALVKQQK